MTIDTDRAGDAGIVSAATPEAAEAGVATLRAGGNAVDAAVAVALSLGVTEPAGSGLGGQTTMLLQRPGEPAWVVNGTSYAPAATPGGAAIRDLDGRQASTVPSTPRVLAVAFERFGSGRLSWAEVVAPSVRIAEEGYVLGRFRHAALARSAGRLRRDPEATSLLLEGDRLPEVGDRVRAPALARTLARIAREGAEDFYTGEIGCAIAADMAAHGGLITARDLAAVRDPVIEPALVGSFRGYCVSTLPPPASGWVGLLALAGLDALGERPSAMIERIADVAAVLASAFRRRRSGAVFDRSDAEAARRPDVARALAAEVLATRRAVAPPPAPPDRGETTHFSIVDGAGMVVAVTQSLNAYFGAKVGCPGTGILYNDYMRDFLLGDREIVAVAAGKPPYSSMCPLILGDAAAPRLALGSPGDERIISAVVQVVRRWIDDEAPIVEAVSAPRLHPLGGGELLVETDLAEPAVVRALEERGWVVMSDRSALFEGPRHPYFGGVHAVAREGGGWTGAADPRRDGLAAPA